MTNKLVDGQDNKDILPIFNALLSECKTTRSRRSLEIINNICSDIARGARDFGYIIVGELSAKNGGPNAQAIRNKNGERYRVLISAYERAYPKPRTIKPETTSSWVDRIEELGLKANVKNLLAEKRKLQSELDVLRKVWSDSGPIIELGNSTALTLQTDRLLPNLTESNYEALKNSIDPTELALSGLRLGEEGSIEDKNGNIVFSYGFVDAIEKIIAIEDDRY
ncbi:gamma-mobile-trio protein GmtX [Vibrio natriegens]|uniref:gamma-mobile-trio protein GmtX n=1 Tax=Vibrio natriegens TaxID=691 RepID=UPI00355815C1